MINYPAITQSVFSETDMMQFCWFRTGMFKFVKKKVILQHIKNFDCNN